ncbi:MAG: hypothetical protein AAF281_06570 [Pseudomonadota bacterium]
MPNVKLEVFTPGAEATEDRKRELARRIAEAYREGHGKGFAQGAEASAREHAEAQDQLRAQFVEALRDAQLTQSLAQREVIASLLPILEALTRALAPTLADAGFLAALEDRLRAALNTRPDPAPRVHCAPELEAGVRAALSQFSDRFELVPDTSLTPLEARLFWEDGFDEIDLDTCLDAMRDTIAAFRDAALGQTDRKESVHVG